MLQLINKVRWRIILIQRTYNNLSIIKTARIDSLFRMWDKMV